MKKILALVWLMFIYNIGFSQYEIPVTQGSWWKIAENEPDVSPYNNPGLHNACDFTIYQDISGKWHLISCIRITTYPDGTRFFYEWEADSLTQVNWIPKGIFWTSGTVGSPDATGRQLGVNTPYTIEGRLQAPHAFKYNNKYYMFHNNAGAFCYISNDGITWDYHKDYQDKYKFFDMGRDVMIFDDTQKSGKWISYYCTSTMVARTADSLRGPWSAETSLGTSGNPESPFVIRRGDDYYLWEQMRVYHSKDPLKFNNWQITQMTPTWFSGKYAPEILYDKGQYYIAGYGNGIWLSKFNWVNASDPSVNCFLKSMTVKEGSFTTVFDSARTLYTVYVKNNVSALNFSIQKSNPSATYSIKDNAGFVTGNNTVLVTVVAPNGTNSKTYTITVVKMAAGLTHLEVVSGSGTGNYTAGSKISVTANNPAVGKYWDKWIGDISFLDNPLSQSTSATLTDSNIVIRTQYRDPAIVTLTVNNGSGGGTHTEGDSVSISANAAIGDSVFLTWTGDVKYLANPILANTKIYIPNKSIKVTASYRSNSTTVYPLTVTGGSGSGSYPAGLRIPVNAANAAEGMAFLKWNGNTSFLEDSLSASTWVTMPSTTTQITAVYYYAAATSSQVSYVKTITSNVLTWRSTSVTKPDDVDADNAFGTAGYYMFSIEKKSLPTFISSSTLGSSTALVSGGGTNSFDDPSLAISATVADYIPGKLDINVADGTEAEFVRLKMSTNASFRLGIISGHAANENCDSVRILIGSKTTPKIAISNSSPQITLFDITANSGDDIIIYGKTRTNAQSRNSIAGIFFDVVNNKHNISFDVKNTVGTALQNAEVILYLYDTLTTNASGFVTFTNVSAPAFLKYEISLAGFGTIVNGVSVGTKDDTVKIILSDEVLYNLSVNYGSGSGNYPNGKSVSISANAPAQGKVFDKWTGDVLTVDDVYASTTTLIMPAANATIIATYKDIPLYSLTVNAGSGSGNYTEGTIITISANTPAVGKVFDKWIGDVSGVANINYASTTLTMPSANASITATYKDAPVVTYTLTVTNGIGSTVAAAGTKVTVTANAAAAGKVFDAWTGDVAYLKNASDSVNEITMPAKNVSITATYKDKPNAIMESNMAISVYPNPANDFVIVTMKGNTAGTIGVVNATGVVMMEGIITSEETLLNVSGWAKGMYVIKIITKESVCERVIVVQ